MGKRKCKDNVYISHYCSVLVKKILDRRSYVTLGYERGEGRKQEARFDEEEVPVKRRGLCKTKKCNCPFKLRANNLLLENSGNYAYKMEGITIK